MPSTADVGSPLPVVPLGESPVAGNQLGNGERRGILFGDEGLPAAGQPLGDETIVLDAAGFGAVGAEIVVDASDRDDRLTGCPVFAVLRHGLGELRHSAAP